MLLLFILYLIHIVIFIKFPQSINQCNFYTFVYVKIMNINVYARWSNWVPENETRFQTKKKKKRHRWNFFLKYLWNTGSTWEPVSRRPTHTQSAINTSKATGDSRALYKTRKNGKKKNNTTVTKSQVQRRNIRKRHPSRFLVALAALGPEENNANADATGDTPLQTTRLCFERVTSLPRSYTHTHTHRSSEKERERAIYRRGGGCSGADAEGLCYLWTRARDPSSHSTGPLAGSLSRIVTPRPALRRTGVASHPPLELLTLSVTHFHFIICPLHPRIAPRRTTPALRRSLARKLGDISPVAVRHVRLTRVNDCRLESLGFFRAEGVCKATAPLQLPSDLSVTRIPGDARISWYFFLN